MKHLVYMISCSVAVMVSVMPATATETAQPKFKRGIAAAKQRQPAPPPIGYDELLTIIRDADLKNSIVSPVGIIQSIRQRCIGFAGTPDQIQVLRDAGAPDELLSLIPKTAPPTEPPKPRASGVLTVNCNPSDCNVWVNGRDRGKAANGVFQISGLRPEETWVEVRRDGYKSSTESVFLEADKPANVQISLKPDPIVTERAGTELLLHLLRNFGVSGAALGSNSFVASGVLSLTGKAGEVVQRDVLVEIGLPDLIRVVTLNGARKRQCSATYKLSAKAVEFGCEARKSSDEALKHELERCTLMLARYYPSIVLDYLLASKVQLSGPAPGTLASPVLLRAVTSEGTWQFGLNKDSYRPDWIAFTGPDNLTWTVDYAGYQDHFVFPHKIVIHDPANKNKTEFSFNRIDAKR